MEPPVLHVLHRLREEDPSAGPGHPQGVASVGTWQTLHYYAASYRAYAMLEPPLGGISSGKIGSTESSLYIICHNMHSTNVAV